MSTEPLTLVLPMPPNLANSRMHWRVKHRERKAYRESLDMLRLTKQVPPPPKFPMGFQSAGGVTLASHLYVWSFMDDDNALARVKWAADWLRDSGYIVDDKRPHCRFTIPEQTVDRKAQRLVLTISRAA